jgi:hypothetical protein
MIPSSTRDFRPSCLFCGISSQHAIDHPQPQHPHTGKVRNALRADSGIGMSIREEKMFQKEYLYSDLRKYLAQKQHHWLLTRNVELAHPLQQRYLAFEGDIMAKIHNTERKNQFTYRQQDLDMRDARGVAQASWKLYQLKRKLGSRWSHYHLHSWWKHQCLHAKRVELSKEYVRAKKACRIGILREIIDFADEEAVEGMDDGGYMRDGMINYIVTGYNSMFPIRRHLEFNM